MLIKSICTFSAFKACEVIQKDRNAVTISVCVRKCTNRHVRGLWEQERDVPSILGRKKVND